MEKWPIGVFTSVGAGLGAGLDAVKELGVATVQLHAPPKDLLGDAAAAQEWKDMFGGAGVDVTVMFCGFEDESYADIPTVHKTVGLVPPATRAERLALTKQISDFAKVMGVPALGMHIGAVPEDANDPAYAGIVAVTQEVCDYAANNGQRFHLETGQESVPTLLRFFSDVGRDNLAINFDPANLILYGVAEPIPALKECGQYVKSCHCKDANWADKPGEEWGAEMPLGQGQVGMEDFIRTLKEIGYEGPLTIERECPDMEEKKRDLAAAIQLLEKLRAEILHA